MSHGALYDFVTVCEWVAGAILGWLIVDWFRGPRHPPGI